MMWRGNHGSNKAKQAQAEKVNSSPTTIVKTNSPTQTKKAVTSAFEEQERRNSPEIDVELIIENDNGTTEEDKDGGSPKQVVTQEYKLEEVAVGSFEQQSSPVVEIGEIDEEMVKRAIQMKPRSLSFVFQGSPESPTDTRQREVKTNYRSSFNHHQLGSNDLVIQQVS